MTQWDIKYAPTNVQGYIFTNPLLQQDYQLWKQNNDIPNIILYGQPGVGKTSFAKMMEQEFGVGSGYLTHWNGGLKNSIDDVRSIAEKLNTGFFFPSAYPKHYVIWDEVDMLSDKALKSLKAVIDSTVNHATFVFTCKTSDLI